MFEPFIGGAFSVLVIIVSLALPVAGLTLAVIAVMALVRIGRAQEAIAQRLNEISVTLRGQRRQDQ